MLLQHDCQEFLALLLDNLHEQLNTASCKSILSDVSTPPPTPHSQCEILDERESARKITDGSDQESFTQVSVWEWKHFCS
jgi:ubiquitin C-terminal hydrolase